MVYFLRNIIFGLVSIGFSLWWNFVLSVQHVYAVKTRKTKAYLSSTTKPVFFAPFRFLQVFPVESAVKILLSVFIYTNDVRVYKTDVGDEIKVDVRRLQHASWYFLFTIQAGVEILIHYGFPFPPNVEYYFLLASAITQFLGWSNRVYSKTDLDHTVHSFVSYVLAAKVVAILYELADRRQYWPMFVRCLVTAMEGTWLIQIAFVMYPPSTSLYFQWSNTIFDKMWLENFFLFHMVGCSFALLAQYFYVYYEAEKWVQIYQLYEQDSDQPQNGLNSNNSFNIK